MRSTLDEALTTLRDLETYVQSIQPVNTVLAASEDKAIRGYLTVRRQLDGAAFIVVLYAAFEKFVEDLVWSRTELESTACNYEDLPEALRDKHLKTSGSLLTKGRLGEGRYASLTAASAVANLHQCLSGAKHFTLNRHAVVYHENNLRPDVLTSLFSLTGIPNINELARQTEPLMKWHVAVDRAPEEPVPPEGAPEEPVPPECAPEKPVPLGSVERRIKEIVELRNQAAHHGVSSGQVLGPDKMREHLEFMRAYCSALYEVVASAYLARLYVDKPGAATALGRFLGGPYRQHGGAVVVRKPACRIYVGQPVIGKRDGRVDRWGTIEDLQINNTPFSVVEAADPATEVGLRVSFKLTKNTELYLLLAKDDAVWS